jgi:Cdc6-like AAA superfamily ATPase
LDYGLQQSAFIEIRKPGTGQRLLDSAEYQSWLSTGKQTLYCPGIPGAGKTITAATVVNDLFERFHDDAGVGVAYAYCNFKRHHEQKLNDLLSSLLKQLVLEHGDVPPAVKTVYEKHLTMRTRPSSQELSTTLRSITSLYSRVFIIIDALDECQESDECRARLISEIITLQSRANVSLFATSRFNHDITERFQGNLSLEISASDEDVMIYLDDRISHSASKMLKKCREEITSGITKAVRGM